MKIAMKSFLLSVSIYATLMVAGPEVVEHRNSSGAGFTLGTNGPEVQAATTPIELYLEQVKPLRAKFDEAFASTSTSKDERRQALDTYNKGARDLRAKFDAAIDKAYQPKEFAEQFKSSVHKAQQDFDTARNAWTQEWLDKGTSIWSENFWLMLGPDFGLNQESQKLAKEKQDAREKYAKDLGKAYEDALKIYRIDRNSSYEKFKKEFIG